MSVWGDLKDAFVLQAMHSPFGGEGLARAGLKGYGYLRGHPVSDAQFNQARDAASAEIIARHKNDHGFVNGATSLVGSLLGGVNPFYAVGGGGSTLAARMATQGAVQGAVSAAGQQVEKNTGQRKHFDVHQMIDDAENGALFQGGGEVLGHAARAVVKVGKNYIPRIIHAADEKIHGPYAPDAPDGMPGNASVPPMDPHTIAKIMNDPAAVGKGADVIPMRRVNGRDRAPDQHISEEDLQDLPPANREYLDATAAKPDVEATPTDTQATEAPPPAANDQAPPAEIPHEDLQDAQPPAEIPQSELTPAEAQEMDASAPKPEVNDSMPDQPYVNNIADEGPPPAANDPTLGASIKDRVMQLINDERGSLGGGDRFEEHKEDPDGTKYLHYTTNSGEKLPIKMGIEPDGTAEIAVDQFGTGANKLGPSEIRQAMYGLMDKYPDIKRFGGYRRSGAGAGRVQEIEPGPRKLADILSNEEGSFNPWSKKGPKLEDIPEEELTPEQRVQLGIRAAQPVRDAQETGYTTDRAKRFAAAKGTKFVNSGEAGFHQELSNLKGPMEQLPSPYSIRPALEQAQVDDLFNQVRDHPALSYTDTVHGRTGLQKLLQNSGAAVPTNSELNVLRKVFPEDPKSPKRSVSNWIASIINAPRVIMASTDLSAPLRQGLPLIHKKEYWGAFASMFKQIGEKGFEAVKDEIASRPSYHSMLDSGLALADVDKDLSQHEEKFMSDLANRIPVFGHVIKASERAYTGFLNKLRADTYDSLVASAKAAGEKVDQKTMRDISTFINMATGRGDLNHLVPKALKGEDFDLNKAAPLMAGMFFAPRLMASRVRMLTQVFDPRFYTKTSPIARREAIKSMLAYTGFVTTTLTLAKAAGLGVETDPRSTDFAKIKVGNTRYDVTGGMQPYVRLAAQVLSGQKKAENGDIQSLSHPDYGKADRLDTIGKFLKNKESPAASQFHQFLTGKDPDGRPIDKEHWQNIAEDMGKDFTPLIFNDMKDVYEDQGVKGVAFALPADTFGIGVNTYKNDKKPSGDGSTKFDTKWNDGFGSEMKGGF